MFASSGDILKMSLAMGFIVFIIFLCILMFYVILILRDLSKMTDDVEEIVHKVKKAVIHPLSLVDYMMSKAKPFIERVLSDKKKGK